MSEVPEFESGVSHDTPKNVDRRTWSRLFPDCDQSQVEVQLSDGQLWPATVTDESFGGISLFASPDMPVNVGETVEVLYHGAPMSCTICSLDKQEGHVRLGCKWFSRSR